MKLRTRLTFFILLPALLLLGATGFVYQHSYRSLEKKIFTDLKTYAQGITRQLHNNFAFIEEDMRLFLSTENYQDLSSKEPHEYEALQSTLQRRFISFFELEYGYRLYDKAMVLDPDGNILASTCGMTGNLKHEGWWLKLSNRMASYFLETNESPRMITVAVPILASSGKRIGVLRVSSSIAALIRGVGLDFSEMMVEHLALVTSDGSLLYSTEFHNYDSGFPDKDLLENLGHEGTLHLLDTPDGHREIVVLQPHTHPSHTSFDWVLALYVNYYQMFSPLLSLRWWIIAGGAVLTVLGCLLVFLTWDVTSREDHEAALLKRHNLLENILTGIHAAVFFIDKKSYTISYVNKIGTDLLGVRSDTLLRGKCYNFICRHGKEFPEKGCPAVEKDILHAEFKLERPDGKVLPVTKTVLDADINGVPHHVAILFDISERKEIERKLAHAQKLEGLGSLAAGMAHEVNTPSQYIADNLRFIDGAFQAFSKFYDTCSSQCDVDGKDIANILAQLKNDTDIEFYFEEMPSTIKQSQEGVERIATIVKALKRFSHPGSDSMQVADINDLLTRATVVCRNEWKYHSNIVFDLDEKLPLVKCLISDLNQVFLNLIVNAAHANSSKFKGQNNKGEIVLHTHREDKNIVITVADNGEGIPASLVDRVFDPFFTTKEVGQGTGQGLSISYAIIVDKHSGSIDITSNEAVGTECTIRLPIEGPQHD